MSAQQIYQNFHGDAQGPHGLSGAQQVAQQLANKYQNRAIDAQQLIDGIQSGWTGDAAEAASQGLMPLAEDSLSTHQQLGDGQDLLSRQVDSFQRAAAQVQPVPAAPSMQNVIAAAANGETITPMLDQIQNYNAATKNNLDAYNNYMTASQYNSSNLPPMNTTLTTPSATVTAIPPALATAGSANPHTRSATSPTRDARISYQPRAASPASSASAPAKSSGGTGPAISDPPASLPTTVSATTPPTAPTQTPPTGVPDGAGSTTTPPGSPGMLGQPWPVNGQPGPNEQIPSGPTGAGVPRSEGNNSGTPEETGGPTSGTGGTDRSDIRRGAGWNSLGEEPTPETGGGGVPSVGGEGNGSGSTGAGAAEEETAAERSLANTRSGTTSTSPLGAARGLGSSGDAEHKRKYDYGEEPDELFGIQDRVAPPVIGDQNR